MQFEIQLADPFGQIGLIFENHIKEIIDAAELDLRQACAIFQTFSALDHAFGRTAAAVAKTIRLQPIGGLGGLIEIGFRADDFLDGVFRVVGVGG